MLATDNSQTASIPTAAPGQPQPAPNQAAPVQTAPMTPLGRPNGRPSVSKAFGKPITVQGRTIIPVAMVAARGTGGDQGSRTSGLLRRVFANG